MEEKQESKKTNPVKYFVCGGIGGMLSLSMGYPMDTIKVKLQTMPVPKAGETPLYTSALDCLRKTIKIDGFMSLYRGITAPLIVAAPVTGIKFFTFALGKKVMEKDDNHIHNIYELGVAGCFAGILASVFVAPSEHVKCLLQTHDDIGPNSKYKGSIDCFQKLYAQGGIRNVYKGLLATIMRDIPGLGIYFAAYESLMELLVPKDVGSGNKIMTTIFAGGVAGICYWVVAMPADVLKTRLQTAPDGKYKGLSDVFRQLMNKEGPRSLFSGLTPILLRAFPVNAMLSIGFEISITVYDWIVPDF